MKIILLGAGQVGSSLAENLASEENDITVVDTDGNRLRELQDRIDIRTVIGLASLPDVLQRAGAEDADMLIAVTNSDEVNMAACQVAFSLFRTPTKIARIRDPQYIRESDKLFSQDAFPIDVLISPERLVTNYIQRLIETPGALQVLDFAGGKLQLVAVRAIHGGLLVGQELRFLKHHMPSVETRVAAIFRKGRAIVPEGSTVIEADDEVFFLAGTSDIRAVMSELRRKESSYKRIVIAGGGNIGYRLAREIEARYSVKVLEHSEDRCQWLSNHLKHAIVLRGDASDQELLLDENIEDTDLFIAVTNDDEANIMASLLAKRLGARKVMTLINNTAYVDLVQGGDIDIAISPSQSTIGSLLTHVRRGDIANVYSLRRGAAEAIEAVAHGDIKTSKVVGRAVEDIDLPEGCSIGAIVRGEAVIIAHDHTIIETGDHVILFLVDKRRTSDVEKLFQVGFSFF
ncbi:MULTISPECIES: Trk system potassium transporter TrkA [Reinekea]|uniref:Trk system potassium transporter TrkA n=2 Tax=Saccharospirillaceae TaxID=255527 RepID=UPI000C22C2CC|nr:MULTISPECIES: Trk system potassium transporter TrkA [Reinekea]MDO7644691.1 Trk system potassium transporter TrkA [Reinekea forsetii]